MYIVACNIVLYIFGPTARWCPMSNHFLTRWVPGYWDWLRYPELPSMLVVHHYFPFRISVFFPFPLLHLLLDFIRVSSLRVTYLHPFDRPLTCWWWVSRLGTGSGTRCCGPRGRAWWYTRGSYFGVPIRPHFVPKWSQIDLKSTTCIQTTWLDLAKKTDFW